MAPSRRSPVARIPREILTNIFLLSRPSIQEARGTQWWTALERSPWSLGQVSRRWRAVALASPALWSFIVIKNPSDDECAPYSLAMLETQLARARTSPLDIVLDYERNDDSDDYVVREALKVLAAHSARWRTLYITAQQLVDLSSLRGRVPLLERVVVWGRDDERSDDGQSPPVSIDHFAIAPRLRSVETNDGCPFFDVPWRQLTRYAACGPWGGHISAFMALKNVESCNLLLADELDLEDPFSHTRTIEMPKLRRLDLTTERTIHGLEEYWVWPTWLQVPALTELAIADGMLQDLPNLLHASKCSLRRLHIIQGCPVADALRPILRSSPEISELLVCLGGYGSRSLDFSHSKVPAVISLLTLKPRERDILPSLGTLIIHCYNGEDGTDDEAVYAMVASRWKTTRLRSLRAVDIGPTLASKLKRLEREGLRLSVERTESKCLEEHDIMESSLDAN
ncbi:hypothetical protein DFH06DRAFT_1487108 [Mycena polygramma]|nr:hypothetical protein DFH06DRAFT_1487108 [Mycena polygramma]